MVATGLLQRVEDVRHFNRFYTQQIGVLREDYLKSPFPVTEARVIYELAHQGETTAAELSGQLGLDPGYLSRILRRFRERGLVTARPSQADGRQNLLRLTEQGDEAFASLNSRSRHQIGGMLSGLAEHDQQRLVEAMRTIQSLLGAPEERSVPYLLRPHQPGDMGWVVHRHGVLYAEEYGWDERFEALVAGIVAKFVEHFDPKRERCWLAEREGEIVGSVFIVKHTEDVAKLRLLLVEPRARGLGIGRRLVDECVRFARRSGYSKVMLWTNSVLLAARHIYEQAGFRLVEAEPHHSFGHDLVGETWELDL
jgi:DNA-binding MarR family transcriptional regulator/N-acetylglutamate synthase-like GNAT family acetyltransferase